MRLKAIVVGARSARQGTGPFIAAALRDAGVRISAIVGTSNRTVEEARAQLRNNHDLEVASYTDLATALRSEQPDLVALCSPWQFHAEQLRAIAEAGCHCLVEKPLIWPHDEALVDELISAFTERGLVLQMVAQWPFTLPTFVQVHGKLPTIIDSFTLRLSPVSSGPAMVVDSAPHFISLLQALCGDGHCRHIEVESLQGGMQLLCDYVHAQGATKARLELEICAERPRPAWYRINDLRVDREVELPDYRQYFKSGSIRCELPDPMQRVVSDFVQGVETQRNTDTPGLKLASGNLAALVSEVEKAQN